MVKIYNVLTQHGGDGDYVVALVYTYMAEVVGGDCENSPTHLTFDIVSFPPTFW